MFIIFSFHFQSVFSFYLYPYTAKYILNPQQLQKNKSTNMIHFVVFCLHCQETANSTSKLYVWVLREVVNVNLI